MKRIYLTLFLIGVLGQLYSQTTSQNYILTRTYTAHDSIRYLDQIQYFDGLGRPMQTVQRGITPNKADLVSLQEYDSFGRDSTVWLPMTSSTDGAFVDPSKLKNRILQSSLYNGDKNPFSKPVYEASPLSRVSQQYAPGEDWHTKGKAAKIDYLANISGDKSLNCILYNVEGTSLDLTLNKQSNYSSSELYITRTADEDGSLSYEFKDKLGQVVLTRQINNKENYDTYYIYDDFGNLCFVLPPRIQSAGISKDSLNSLAYQYRYDYRNRCIWKKLPGCEPIFYGYDKADQLVYTQDGEQRSRQEWLFSLSDIFGRNVLTAVTHDTIPIFNKIIRAQYAADGLGKYQGYEIIVNNISLNSDLYKEILSVNYYDNYNFLAKNQFPNQIYDKALEVQGFGKCYDDSKGQLTGSIIALFGNGVSNNSFLYTTMYYDNRARVIQTRSTNHLKGEEIEYVAYNFTGQPTSKLHIHNNKTKIQEEYTYHYDHAGRLIETEHKIDGFPRITLSKNKYDELGRLQNRIIGGNQFVNKIP